MIIVLANAVESQIVPYFAKSVQVLKVDLLGQIIIIIIINYAWLAITIVLFISNLSI